MDIWHYFAPVATSVALMFLLAAAVVFARRWGPVRKVETEAIGVGSGLIAAVVGAWPGFFTTFGLLGITIAVLWRWRYLNPSGAALYASGAVTPPVMVSALPLWATTTPGLPGVVVVACWAVFVIGVVTWPVQSMTAWMLTESVCRDRWSEPTHADAGYTRVGPMVSIHVPTYSEPPGMVIETLESLARLDYARFEVIVVDNNTQDRQLWEPVQQKCAQLGRRFRFFHVDPLDGAKGGALNYALDRTHLDAQLVAVVDADHQLDRGFLARLVGHFNADSDLGAIQIRYDFRDWSGRAWMRSCFWSYREGFPTIAKTRNERRSAWPMGTMCMFRFSALAESGGWSETSLTEDWDMGLRLAERGYYTRLVQDEMGTGLIPDRHRDFATQRFRWVYGPVQTLKQRWSVLTGHTESKMTRAQRTIAFHHGLQQLLVPVGLVQMALLAMVVLTGPFVPWSAPLITVLVAGAVAGALVSSAVRREVGASWRDFASSSFALASLVCTVALASVTALFTKSTQWRRTNKFASKAIGWSALKTVRAEIVFGAVLVAVGIAGLVVWPGGAGILACLALIGQGFGVWAAPVAVVLADRELSR